MCQEQSTQTSVHEGRQRLLIGRFGTALRLLAPNVAQCDEETDDRKHAYTAEPNRNVNPHVAFSPVYISPL